MSLVKDDRMVAGRELHKALEVKTPFKKWIDRVISRGFREGNDYKRYFKSPLEGNRGEDYESPRFSQEEMESMTPQQRSAYGVVVEFDMTLAMAKDVCRKQKGSKRAGDVLKLLLEVDGQEVYFVDRQRKEIEFLTVLEKQLQVLGITRFERQYSKLKCGNYRIDLYLPEINVAIEYDENGHKRYTYEAQELRQELIEKELGCRFIRVSDDKDHVTNSAIVIRELILHNLLNN